MNSSSRVVVFMRRYCINAPVAQPGGSLCRGLWIQSCREQFDAFVAFPGKTQLMTTPAAGSNGPETFPPQSAARPSATARRGFLSSSMRATLAVAAVVALLGLGSVPWLLSSPTQVSAWAARALPQMQADVRLGSVKLGWLGPLVLEDIRVVPRDGTQEPISIKRIELSHGLAGILLSLGDLGRLRIEGLDARVVFDADRNSNLKGLFRPVDRADGLDADQKRGPQRSPLRLQLDVVDAIVRIAGPWSDEPWVSDPINVRAALRPAENGRWSEWTIEPVQLLADARLEPAVAQGVLAYIAPVMADATRTAGRFSLRLNRVTLPVGAPDAGQLSGVLSMHAVDLGPGPLVTGIIEALPFNLPAPPVIRIADQSHVEFQMADRRMWHKGLAFGVPLAKPGQRLDLVSSGSVGLDDKALDLKLELPIPADLPQDRPLLASLAGRTFAVKVGGVLGEPRVNFDGTLRATAGEVVSELVGRLRGQRVPAQMRPPQGSQPLPQPPAPGWKPDGSADAPVDTSKPNEPAAVKPDARTDSKPDSTADAVID
ncbi:MAG: hypothetical protein ACKO6B_05510, partial [Planctomycetia bacterium]